MNLATLSARGIVEATTDGRTCAVEVVEAYLATILDHEEEIRAWAHLDGDLALAQARALDSATERGPMHGVPVGVKDIVDTADQPTVYGSAIYDGHRPDRDAALVTRLRRAGAVIVGKTVTTELALFTPGPTLNPHDRTRTPGGSSSGSAAAVAARMVPLAVGSQTAGSIVRPAAFCGVFGAKPSFGRIPVEGVKEVSASLDTIGALARDVDDLALMLGVMADDIGGFEPSRHQRPVIGFCRTPQWDALELSTRDELEAAAERLAGATEVVEVRLPEPFDDLVGAQKVIMGTEALVGLSVEARDHFDELSEQLRAYLDDAGRLNDRHPDARATVARCNELLGEVFDPVDALLVPATLGEAPERATTGDPLPCRMWTQLGVPAVAVPGLRGPRGLPLGVQVVAPFAQDDVALGVAGFVGEVLAD